MVVILPAILTVPFPVNLKQTVINNQSQNIFDNLIWYNILLYGFIFSIRYVKTSVKLLHVKAVCVYTLN